MRKVLTLFLFLICLVSILPLASAQILVEEKQIFTSGATGMVQNDACQDNEKKCSGTKVYYCSAGSWRIEDKCGFDEACVIELNGCVKKLDLPSLMEESNLVYDENGTIVKSNAENDDRPILINGSADVDLSDPNAPLLIPYDESNANGEEDVGGESVSGAGFENYLIQGDGKEKVVMKDVESGFDFRFTTKTDIHKENGEFFILDGDMKYYVKFTPEEVMGNLFPQDDVVLKSVELIVYQEKATFKIEQKVRGKFLGLIPANTKKTFFINSENNELMRTKKPWYMKVE